MSQHALPVDSVREQSAVIASDRWRVLEEKEAPSKSFLPDSLRIASQIVNRR
jgi:hypothetical protein